MECEWNAPGRTLHMFWIEKSRVSTPTHVLCMYLFFVAYILQTCHAVKVLGAGLVALEDLKYDRRIRRCIILENIIVGIVDMWLKYGRKCGGNVGMILAGQNLCEWSLLRKTNIDVHRREWPVKCGEMQCDCECVWVYTSWGIFKKGWGIVFIGNWCGFLGTSWEKFECVWITRWFCF